METTYLVQRLRKSHNNQSAEMWSFGGGLKNGGLSEDAMKLLRPIFSFDYMGSAEFEFGAIPESFRQMAKNISTYKTWGLAINKVPIYVIGVRYHADEINDIIKLLSKNKIRLKEYSGIPWALGLDEFPHKRECDYIGWLELNNNFMLFTDKLIFEKTAELFGLKTNIK